MKERTKGILALLAGVAVLALLGLAALLLARPAPETLQGEADATKVDVAAKVAGRLATIEVKEGDPVKRGDLVATLESPEIRARLDQAEAARAGAVAQRDKADSGAREEEIRAAKSQWDRARHAADLAEVTFGRLDRLARDGVVPNQRRDEAEAQWRTSRDAAEAAKAMYDLALAGARREDRASAAALVSRAEGAVDEVQAYLDETKVAAPAAGEVYRRNVEPGEIVPAGFPIVTLVDLSDLWVTFQVREDLLERLKMGATVPGRFPALGNEEVALTVSFVAPQGDFATWRATSAQGGFDLKTFEVRARPARPVPGLRPGMSAVVTWPR
ncbi:MAG: efflux RND transporter periplasmic adaptor subunit [Thermoanaerobaculia bacterium]|nr:efflux RND transporter periplasmic adaptor subunit [Thermoanaerobaculia bacterium]